jgi:phospholipase C
MASLQSIDHFVVLMLENRSFDSVLGALYPKSPAFEGIDGTETNIGGDGRKWLLTKCPVTKRLADSAVPAPDPGELWTEMNLQIFGSRQLNADGSLKKDAVADMSGFIESYTDITIDPSRAAHDPQKLMSYYDPRVHMPALASLAEEFAVCDCWFASAPCQTWPNRFFLHTGTAAGYENNQPKKIFDLKMKSVFESFNDAGLSDGWAIYHHDIPQTATLTNLRMRSGNFHLIDTFVKNARDGKLPRYSFIEPRYYADIDIRVFPPRINLSNDQHPPHIVTFGDGLVASVYNALRSNVEAWKKTMLVIIYDEHGGCFDHVPPAKAVPPGKGVSDNPNPVFAFDRFGVRVPAVIASPYINRGTILRPSDTYPGDGATPFDHTSVIKTLQERFNLGAPLTDRVAAAPTLERVLNLDAPQNLGPLSVTPSSRKVGLFHKLKALWEPWGDFQDSLHEAARKLPPDNHGRAQRYFDRHVTNPNPDKPDGADSDATAMWEYAKNRALKSLRIR